ncbi:MAG: type VI secretion system membrane subunit TssM [Pseudomonadota bacterium]
MQIMTKLRQIVLKFIMSPIGLTLIVIGALGAAIWFFGPLLQWGDWVPLDSEEERFIGIGIMAATVLLILLIVWLVRRRRGRKLEEKITDSAAEDAQVDPSDTQAQAEIAELQGRMKEALSILKKAKLGGKGGRKSLYQLPWYIMIGPPGAGKTTAIVNSGLKFPLAEKMGKAAITGVGGTRNCDWWFTNEAVLIDTAGRYTTQESDVEADSKSWLGFLDILKTTRPRQPVNGAIVAISLSDLSLQDEAQRRNHALAVRTRLRELREKLGVRFPVYVVFTKADLIVGFMEFFDRLGKEDREQVWGFTFPYKKGEEEGDPVARFDGEFDALLQRLNDRCIELLQQEVDHHRRSLIYGFPQQVESLRGVAKEFLGEVFQESRFEQQQLFRGIYFASGTQEGTPIDRLMRGMAQAFGIGRQAVTKGHGQGKSFFLTRLLESVMFPEAGLVSADDKVERRYKWIWRGSVAAGLLVTGLFGTLWTISYLGNADLIETANAEVVKYREATARIQVNPVEDFDLASVVGPLNTLRDMPGNPTVNDPEPPTSLTWGLYQGDAVGTEAAQSYRNALNTLLLPRLLLRLEEQMQSNFNKPDLLYQALRVYLMLGLQGPMDEDFIRTWLLVDWSFAFPGPENQGMRNDLLVHYDALVASPMKQLALNGNLVDAVRSILADRPAPERIYQSIVTSPEAKEVPTWRITEAAGPQATRVLVRPSGEPLSEGIEGIYTYRGFTEVFIDEALAVPERMQREGWVLGESAEELSEDRLAEVTRDVLNLYYDDYVDRWDRVLSDIDIVPPNSISDAVRITNILSGATSPVKNILESASKETALTRRETADGELPIDSANVDAATSVLVRQSLTVFDTQTRQLMAALSGSKRVSDLVGSDQEEVVVPGQYVEEQFAWLRDLTFTEEGVPSRLDEVIAGYRDVYDELNRRSLNNEQGALAKPGQDGAPQRLEAMATDLQEGGPLKRWTIQVVQSASNTITEGVRPELNKIWQSDVGPFCRQALENRYPFSRGAAADVTIQDFGALFAPGGKIDGFFKQHLIDYVDTTSKPWRWRRVNNVELGISPAVLTQFQNAADIRDAFFLTGQLPAVTFDLKPIALDSKATSVVLEIEGQKLEYAHQVPETTPLKWPGSTGGRTRVAFTPQQPDTANSLQSEGPWSWFRLLDQAEVRRTNVSDRSKVIFSIGGRIAVFQLRAGSALNPFSLPALQAFRCVNSL